MAKKSSKKRRSRGIIKTVFNPRQWMSYDSVRDSGQGVKDMFKDLTKVQQSTRTETFEEALKRLNMTEEDVKNKMSSLYMTAWVYFGIGVAIMLYCLFSLFTANFLPFLVAAVLSMLAFALAFRDSFFYFQMKKRKLGCTVKEWVDFITRRG